MLGIDVGATGIKGSIVNLKTGEFLVERIKYDTPKPATPSAVAATIRTLALDMNWKEGDTIGCGFPSVVRKGRTLTAANIDKKWINLKARKYLSQKTGYDIRLVNDADAAAMAEVRFGHVSPKGTVLLLTLGTGIGSALFRNGELIPNTEFGHMPYKRSIAEDYVSNRGRKDRGLSMAEWARQLGVYLEHLNKMLNPELIILGGGISKKFDLYKQHLNVNTEVVPARMFNDAGIVGAALYGGKVQP